MLSVEIHLAYLKSIHLRKDLIRAVIRTTGANGSDAILKVTFGIKFLKASLQSESFLYAEVR